MTHVLLSRACIETSSAYGSHVGIDGRAAFIDVGELYDGDERRFLVLVYAPGGWGRRGSPA